MATPRDLLGRHPLQCGELWSATSYLHQLAEQVKREYALKSIARSSVNGASLLLAGADSMSIASAGKSQWAT